MWKETVVIFLISAAVVPFLNLSPDPEVPTYPETYWGPGKAQNASEKIQRFRFKVAKTTIDDLMNRLKNHRSLAPPLEGAAWTYGISSKYLDTIVKFWQEKYNWSQRLELLNKYPQYTTNIQGLNIHFYHVKPVIPKDRKLKVFPLLMVHGWPGSIVEFQKIIPLLTTPREDQDFVFELVLPSLPGYGFSDPAARPGMTTTAMAVIFKNLMTRLGFDKFYVQGGDWGSAITADLAILFPERVIGVHSNMCMSMATSVYIWTAIGSFIPSLVVDKDHYSRMYPISYHWSRVLEESGYMHIQASKPDTVGTALSDSPIGLAAYILEKFSTWTNPDYRFRDDGGLLEKFTLEELLDNVMVYWLSNSIVTSMRLYSENFQKDHMSSIITKLPIKVPSGCAIFPHELLYQPESLIKSRYQKLIHFNHMPRGGHFAAFEEPQLLADDIWSFIKKREDLLKKEKEQAEKKKSP
ncbi:juvenile hormone epoxide hydrolase 1 [Orussus abietinus]|uniref:juvenile hormone epoxide hydrolase 1 n=1 Tax=Orussus abietinus TaxID=222816 RepID=UPI000626B155|nr:juvenile hormone epoxide hydrolase 1 [Orussus abietinus]